MRPHDPVVVPSIVANDTGERGGAVITESGGKEMLPNHRYTVEIRFVGDRLDPSEISRRLHLQPSSSMAQIAAGSSGRRRIPFWAYNGKGEAGFCAEWQSLEQGLEFLVQRIAPVRSVVIELSKSFNGIWWCGHFQSSFDGGPTLSPRILVDVASFGLPLSIDNYFGSE
jgi:hypothetical protein